ncbi:MAG: OadG family protein [Candidatus Faecousia sp.]|nr:OadG family protein [Candidatus Faecousia sp.]
MMFLAATIPDHLQNISFGNAAVVALLGYCVVFFGIVLLMCVITIMGKIFMAKANKAKAAAPAPAAPVTVTPVAAAAPEAPGSAGQLKLHDVPPKTAAMLMAIVADQMGKPLNELRFISIKEVK